MSGEVTTRQTQASRQGPRVWAVGGGKGGVGKSVVASNLAIALAAGGPRAAVIDADLGGANLHTLLGVSRPPRTMTDFLRGDVRRLDEVLCPTSVPDVWLASGARALLEGANPKHSQKLKMLRHLRKLDVGHVVLDLGAGSTFNTLDFFLAADHGLLVIAPEPTSVENAYHFLKAAFFRSLRRVALGDGVRTALEAALRSANIRARTPRRHVDAAAEIDPEAGRLLRARAQSFSPQILVNQVERTEDRRLGPEICTAARLHLGAEADYAGCIPHDRAVPESVRRQLPVLQLFPTCAFSTALRDVATRLQRRLPEQAELHRGARHPEPPMAACGLEAEGRSRGRESAEAARTPVRAPAALPPLDVARPGRYLRLCREHLGLALAELSARTRIRRLDHIEDERFAELPPEPYLRGYVTQYARALGIAEAERVAASFLDLYRRAGAAAPSR
jgi:flagellar biosynthesis protein FlhG